MVEGYQLLQKTHSGDRFEIFRAERIADGRAVVLKTCRPGRSQSQCGQLLRHELDVLQRLDVRGVARPVELLTFEGMPALVLEDAGRQTLADYMHGRPLDPGAFLDLAIRMAEIVGELHGRNVIHCNISPDNFLIGQAVTLVDFSIATAVPAFSRKAGGTGQLEGSLAYIAPEQTGRTKHPVDHRADLYALGATYYEMLTGGPPFTTRDPLELVHAHVARSPYAPAVVNANVPTLLSDIVLKLLQKTPEWRYQSVEALRADLEEARRQWQSRGAIASFEIGRYDLPHGLLVQRTLYGRDRQMRELEQAFARAAAGGREMVLIAGRAGAGKTSVVRGLERTVEGQCCWLEGKGDLLSGHVPYASIVAALSGLMAALREQPRERTAALVDRLRHAVGPLGGVLTQVIPGLEQLIGEQAAVPDVGPVEAANRLQLVFASFMGALGERGATTVLFLDDLQWADGASLELLRAVVTDPDIRHLLIVGAYRADDVDAPALRAIESVYQRAPEVRRFEVGPFDEPTLVHFLRDVLRTTEEEAFPLAKLVIQKTGGNPFSVRRMLGLLHREGMLVFHADRAAWSWDLGRIAALGGTEDDVVELTAASVRSQTPATRDALKAAACIGNQFDLRALAATTGRSPDEMAQALWDPLRDGIIAPVDPPPVEPGEGGEEPSDDLGSCYRFAHDRFQQAAYELLDEDERARFHLRIGRQLLQSLPGSSYAERICAVVDQLDRAAALVTGDERTELAEMNHRAGRRAHSTSAFASALAYFQQGLALLPEDPWSAQHGLWFSLQRDAAECAALSGEHALADRLIDEGLARTDVVLEKAAFYAIAVAADAGRGLHAQAIAHGEEALKLLGMELPRDGADTIARERARAQALLETRSTEEALQIPREEDAEKSARLQLLLCLTAPAWYASEDLFELLSMRAVQMSLEGGLLPEAATACGSYAVSLAIKGEYAGAHLAGRFALRVAERVGNPAMEARVLMMVGGHVSPWREPLRQSIPLLRRSLALGIQSGELVFSSYAAEDLVYALLVAGMDLDRVIAEAAAVMAHYRKIDHPWDAMHVAIARQSARLLKGLTRSIRSFDDQEFDEASFLAAASENVPAQALYHFYRLQTSYLMGDFAVAQQSAQALAPFLPVFRSLFLLVDYFFYRSLVLAARFEETPLAEREAVLGEMGDALRRLQTWAENAPDNWCHKRDLLAAEMARVSGRTSDALGFYQRAIERAGKEKFRHDEALAHELCARFHAARSEKRMALLHFGAAVEGYARWGAAAKVEQLRQGREAPLPVTISAHLAPDLAVGPALDQASLVKVIETLTGELNLDRLLEKVIRICGEAAAAERAVLILNDGGLVVRAVANVQGEVTLVRTPLDESEDLPASVIERVHRRGQAVVLGNAARAMGADGDPYFARNGTRSVLAVPIGDGTLGVLYFENNLGTDAFTSDRVEMFRLLSAPIAVALQNSFLFDERERAETALRLLVDAGATLAESLDFETTVKKVAELIVPALADWCVVDVYDNGALRCLACSHVNRDKLAIVRELHELYPVDLASPQPQAIALRAGKPFLVSDATDETIRSLARDQRHYEMAKALSARSIMVIPLMARDRALGTVTFTTSQSGRRYGPAELAVAQSLGRRIALAIDSARLFRESQQAVHTREEAIRMRDEFLSIASHELRTPITSLQLAIEGLRTGRVPPTVENITRSLALSDRQILRLSRLVEELLGVARIQAGHLQIELQPVDLAEIVRDVANSFAADLARAGSSLEIQAPPHLVGEWDRSKLEQVVVNLVSNAVKFGAGRPIAVALEEKNGSARLTVTDHGIGIEPEKLSGVFEKFERAVSSREYGGLGLGLYITRSIVRALGGTVKPASDGLGQGATFTVELPLSRPRAVTQSAAGEHDPLS